MAFLKETFVLFFFSHFSYKCAENESMIIVNKEDNGNESKLYAKCERRPSGALRGKWSFYSDANFSSLTCSKFSKS